jgi:hypothetical protein
LMRGTSGRSVSINSKLSSATCNAMALSPSQPALMQA